MQKTDPAHQETAVQKTVTLTMEQHQKRVEFLISWMRTDDYVRAWKLAGPMALPLPPSTLGTSRREWNRLTVEWKREVRAMLDKLQQDGAHEMTADHP